MNAMRAFAVFAAAVLSAGALAGCVGNKDGEETTPASTNNPLGTGTDGVKTTLDVLASLKTGITTSAPQWVAPGTAIDVAAAAPTNAKGAVTYTWAVGPLPGTVAVDTKLDTKTIEPGAAKELKYATAGIFRMHCHPHPDMKHNVTVVDGYAGPKTVHVAIVDDGKDKATFRFVPENILVGVGTTVVYHNNGTAPHTATLETAEPPLKATGLKTASGSITLSGAGWQRIVVAAQDADGRFGSASHSIYVADIPAPFTEDVTFEFNTGSHGVVPAEQQAAAGAAPIEKTFTFTNGGTVFLNWTAADAAYTAAAPGSPPAEANTAAVAIHLKESGATQDTLTGDAAASGALSGKINPMAYTLTIVPESGVKPAGKVTVTVVYDLVPPAPSMGQAGGEAHGGHAH